MRIIGAIMISVGSIGVSTSNPSEHYAVAVAMGVILSMGIILFVHGVNDAQ